MFTLLVFLAGLGFLVVGAELLVRGASRLAAAMGVTPLVIGLTVVSFGTSAPELAVSIKAALSGQTDVALGNAIGSNIFNVLFILGLAALIAPLIVSNQLIRIDVPIMVGISLLTLVMGLDGTIGKVDGVILVTGLLAYTGLQIQISRKSEASNLSSESAPPRSRAHWVRNTVVIVVGLGLLAFGSQWVVRGAIAAANHLGISPLVTSLTIIAAGTSLPEVVTSVIASIRGERDIAVGNVVGSNIFNLLGVLGSGALVASGGILVAPSVLSFDLPIMIAVAFACVPLFFTGGIISRWEGGLLFAYYLAYTTYIVLVAGKMSAASVFGAAMYYFILPLTALTLLLLSFLAFKRKP